MHLSLTTGLLAGLLTLTASLPPRRRSTPS